MIDYNGEGGTNGFYDVGGTAWPSVSWSSVGVDNSFNAFDGETGSYDFTIDVSGVGGLTTDIEGSIASGGGTFNVGGNGGGIDNASIDATSEYWQFTFSSHNVTLTDINYYGPDAGQQSVLTNGTAVTGSPFGDDVSDASIEVTSGDSIRFGYVENAGNGYTLTSFDVTVEAIPEPSTLAIFGLGAAALLMVRRRLKG
jgi:alanine-alpha-ketoisovalerate/valine-pyruvate aminotransferase